MSVSPAETLAELSSLLSGYWKTQAIYAAVSLGVIDALDRAGTLQATELAAELGLNDDAVQRLMTFLDAIDVVAGAGEGFTLAPIGEALCAHADGGARGLALLYGSEFYVAWSEIRDVLTSGEAGFERAHGTDLFDFLERHPDVAAAYEDGMSAGRPFFEATAEAYDFSTASLIVDVAGGYGTLLDAILSRYPEPHAVLLDRPHVTAVVQRDALMQAHGGRCSIVSGDFFQAVPASGDVYLLSRILHCFDDARNLSLLRNVRAAMKGTSRVLIVERVLDDERDSVMSAGFNMHMLVVLGGGRERTLSQFDELLARVGLRLDRVTPLAAGAQLLEAVPVRIA